MWWPCRNPPAVGPVRSDKAAAVLGRSLQLSTDPCPTMWLGEPQPLSNKPCLGVPLGSIFFDSTWPASLCSLKLALVADGCIARHPRSRSASPSAGAAVAAAAVAPASPAGRGRPASPAGSHAAKACGVASFAVALQPTSQQCRRRVVLLAAGFARLRF